MPVREIRDERVRRPTRHIPVVTRHDMGDRNLDAGYQAKTFDGFADINRHVFVRVLSRLGWRATYSTDSPISVFVVKQVRPWSPHLYGEVFSTNNCGSERRTAPEIWQNAVPCISSATTVIVMVSVQLLRLFVISSFYCLGRTGQAS